MQSEFIINAVYIVSAALFIIGLEIPSFGIVKAMKHI